jgi:hypothetical protein
MTGGLLNIISYGSNDLYLTGAPQVTFFKTVYRRYTNFAVESIEVNPNTNTNFNEEFQVIIPRYGDLLSKTYLKIDLPEVYFSYNEFEFTAPPSPYNPTDENNYNTVVEFMKYNAAAYRSIKRDSEIIDITTADISYNLFNLLNGPGQQAQVNFNNLYSIDLSGTIDGLDIKYLLKTSDIFSTTSNLLLVDTSNNDVINNILNINNKGIESSIKCQEYYFNKKKLTDYNYELNQLGNLKFAWNKQLGHTMIEYIDVYIGGEFIDRTEGEFLEIYSQLTLKHHLEDAYKKMIGNVEQLTTFNQNKKPAYTLLIPLQFWFTKNYGSAFPLVASEHNDVIIKIKFRNINDCATIENLINYDYTLEDLWNNKKYNLNCSLFVDYIYLDYLERKKFAQSAHEYLIETVQSVYDYIDLVDYIYHLEFKHPCKELYFFFQKNIYRQDNTGKNKDNFNNYSSDISGTINSIVNALLNLNGFDKINKYIGSGTYYNIIQPWIYHKKNPNVGVLNYSFSLVPEELQPSGTLNFSRIKDVLFTFNINSKMFEYNLSDINYLIEPGSIDDELVTTNVLFKMYGICYNILRIKNGYCGLAFSAF